MILAAVAGALSVVAQSVLVRELAVLFRNNELVLGILLGAWLAGSGAGAAGLRFIPQAARWRPAWLLLAQMVLVLAAVFAARWLFGVWQFHARPPLPVVAALAFALTAPAGALAGLVFSSLAAYRYGPLASSVWVAEAAGACAGGLAFTALAEARWHGIDVTLAALFVVLVFVINGGRARPLGRLVLSIAAPVLGLYLCLPLLRAADDAGRQLQYRKTPLVIARESKWGHLALVGGPGGGAYYYNGEVVVQRDLAAEEEAAFLPVLASGIPRSILVLGFCPDTLVEAWQGMGVRRITTVLQDGLLTLFEAYGSGRRPGFLFSVRLADPFRWRTVVRDRYDLVILREPLPVTIAANRFFSREFLRGLKDALEPGGAIVLSAAYEENGLAPETARALAIVRGTLRSGWDSTETVPAGSCWFVAADRPVRAGVVDAHGRLKALRGRGRFVNEAWIRHVFAAGRRARFASALDAAGPVPVNGVFGMALFRDVLRGWVRRDSGGPGGFLLAVLAVVAAFAAWRTVAASAAGARVAPATWWMAAAGFAAMTGEIELLLWYQGVTGRVYHLFGLLTALFMLGAAAGGRAGIGGVPGSRGVRFAGLWLGGWVAAVGCLFLLPGVPGDFVAHAVAFALSAFGGAALGAVFTGAARHHELSGHRVPASAGTRTSGFADGGTEAVSNLYAADLAGSAVAAVAAPVVLVPSLGLAGTALVAVAILAAGHVVAGRHKWG